MIYRVEISNSRVEKQILKLSREDRNRIANKILELENEPYPAGIRKLKNDIYRLRIGKYRVIYEVNDRERIVIITKVERRKERTYKALG